MRKTIAIAAIALSLTPAADAGSGKGRARPSAHSSASSVREFERLLASLDEQEEHLEEEISALEPKIGVVARRMKARGRAYYRMVRAGLLPVGGGFDALVDHAAAMERLRSALGRDIETHERLKKRLASAKNELRRTRAERAPLMIQKEAMERAKTAMQQADERRAAFSRAFGGSAISPSDTAIYGAARSSAGAVDPFPERRGLLPIPLTGRAELIEPTDAATRHGVILVGVGDSDVRAVHPGRVTFAGKTVYGDTVVLHHGERYFSIYGRMHHMEVKHGEVVPDRARLGWVLRYGNQSPALYFELRHGDEVLDAASWLGL